MRVSSKDYPRETRAGGAEIDELRVVGGESALEGRELAAAAAAAGLSVRWLDFAGAEARAAIAAQGAGSVRLPLVIVDGTHTLQRPQFAAVAACIAALRRGDADLPAGVVALGRDPQGIGGGERSMPEACAASRQPRPPLAA